MTHSDEQNTSKLLILMEIEKPITPDPRFIKPIPYQRINRKLFLTVEMVITLFPFMETTVTSPFSSHHRDVIVIKMHHRTTFPLEIATAVALQNV